MSSNTPNTVARLDPDLIEAAARAQRMTDRRPSSVIRYALALAAGQDPARATDVRTGPKTVRRVITT